MKRFQPDWSVEIRPIRQENTPSTLLIPASLEKLLLKTLKQRGYTISVYLRILLRSSRFLTLDGGLPVWDRCKTAYQDKGQDLQRWNFRPDNDSWLELSILARSYGISRCYLFIILFLLDVNGAQSRTDEVTTETLGRYDRLNPYYIQFTDRLYIFRNKYTRGLRVEPEPIEIVPWDVVPMKKRQYIWET